MRSYHVLRARLHFRSTLVQTMLVRLHHYRRPARPLQLALVYTTSSGRPNLTLCSYPVQPTDVNVEAYIREFKAHNVCDLVRACECGYSSDRILKSGVAVHDMPFPDGDPPPDAIIASWLGLCGRVFAKGNPDKRAIAVHCVAGLGRAPVLVAIALIEQGLEPLEAVTAIRARRRGAINARQLQYLEHAYKRRAKGKGCCVM